MHRPRKIQGRIEFFGGQTAYETAYTPPRLCRQAAVFRGSVTTANNGGFASVSKRAPIAEGEREYT
eukprot:9148069-Pyramimonas_sp.AAC.1